LVHHLEIYMLVYILGFILAYIVMAQSIPQNVILGLRSMLSSGFQDESEKKSTPTVKDLTPIDIVVTRIMLTKGKKLPPDVVDVIFDFAEYWAHSSNEIDYIAEHSDPLMINGASPVENKFLVS